MRRSIFIALLMGLSAAAEANTLPAPTGMPCREKIKGLALDFWIGDWKVVDAKTGALAGTNLVTRELDGCAVTENWHGVTAGDDGKSLFTYDARRHTWDQVWVTADTTRAGGLKHKTMLGIFYANAVKFQGRIDRGKDGVTLDRTTLLPMTDGRVRQTIEWSTDNGKHWRTVFDSFYIRKGAKPDLDNAPGGDPR